MSSDGPVHFPTSEPAEPQLNGHGEPHSALADTDTDLHTDTAADEAEVGQTEVGQSIQTAETGADEDHTVLLEQNAAPAAVLNSSSSSPPSRTVAIIKPHALEHRFNIESRISEAGFEIVKERQMEIDVETNPDVLYELFGPDASAFAEGPVWVYILERRRAVQVWQTLMGPADPALAQATEPSSLRALYGLSATQNGVMGSMDREAAEMQIAALFASSPPLPSVDLPDAADRFGSVRSIASSMLSAFASNGVASTGATSTGGGDVGTPVSAHRRLSSGFKARPVPATTASPSITPRMSRSSAIRAGLIVVDDVPAKSAPRAPLSKERLAATFADVPGHGFRSQKIAVASTQAPAIAPRMTRAAALRLGLPADASKPSSRPRASTAPSSPAVDGTPEKKGTFDGVPGHKRRESISVASTKAPAVAPRLNKAASLRSQKSEGAPPSAFNMRGAPPLERSNSRSSLASAPGGFGRPSFSRSTSQASVHAPASTGPSAYRANASMSVRRAPSLGSAGSALVVPRASMSRTPSHTSLVSDGDGDAPTKAKAPRTSSAAAPAMVPRQNKAAMLRAAKMAAKAPAPPPVASSMKAFKADRRKSLPTF